MRQGEGLRETAKKWAQWLSRADDAPAVAWFGAELWALSLASLLGAALLLRPSLAQELVPALQDQHGAWRLALVTLPAATIVIALSVGSLTYGFVRQVPSKTWRHLLSVSLTLGGWFFILSDFAIYQRFGRHWDDLLAYARLPEANAAAGDATANLLLFGMLVAWAFGTTGLTLGLRLVCGAAIRSLSTSMQWLATSVGGTVVISLVATLWLVPSLLPGGFGPRLYESLALRPIAQRVGQVRLPSDPGLRQLQIRLQEEYRRLFPFIFKRHHLETFPKSPLDNPPNIALVVAESFRWEQLNPELMPRLFAWSQRGLRANRHYSASNHSESGLFVLLYGESPLRFSTTLDQHTPPALFELLQASNYRCGYYTGHPKIWLRREEFLNERTLDDFVHNNQGSWNDWDRKALQASTTHLADGKRRLSLTFLMSSHYEYRYPDRYRKHVPDDPPKTSWLPGRARPREFLASKNRYFNVTHYLDDLVADYIESLDSRTLVIFTADHGESTGEDGRFGHGYGFSDPLTRIPLVIVGPGFEPEVRDEISSHQDLLPTLAAALELTSNADSPGSALQKTTGDRALLSTYTQVGRPVADALLLLGRDRLKLRLDPTQPLVEVLGFEDDEGRPLAKSPSDEDIEQLTAAFAGQLEAAGRPLFSSP